MYLRTRIFATVAAATLAILAVLFIACDVSEMRTWGHPGSATVAHAVRYEIAGTLSMISLVTIENESGGTSQFTDVTAPWKYSFTGHTGDFVYVSGQAGSTGATLTASIYLDEVLFKTSTSSGDYVIAASYGSLP